MSKKAAVLKKRSQKMLSNEELSAFCGQMAMILKAGISSVEGLGVLQEDAQNDSERDLLGAMTDDMNETGTLWHALDGTGVFPAYVLRMTKIGEETGTLDDVMSTLSTYYERQESISSSIRSSLTYPLIMAGMMLLIIIVLITKVMPVFNQVFTQLGQEMTGLSLGILNTGMVLSKYAYVFVALALLVLVLLIYLTKTDSGRVHLRNIAYHFSGPRSLYDKMAACRFAGGLSLSLKSGMTPEYGLEMSKELVDDPHFLKKVANCDQLFKTDASLAEALGKSKIFTGVYAKMAAIADRTGTMDEVLDQIASQYTEDVDDGVNSFIAVLEPTLVIILAVIVGIILLSVMLPLLGIMSGL